MDLFLAAGGGFLVAVIWMDLMFDVLALRAPSGAALAEDDLGRIAAYYRRVTTDARPMNHAIGCVMAAMVATLAWQLAQGGPGRGPAAVSLALCGVPIVLALTRVFPNAMRLGSRRDDTATQSRLARSICVDHLLCISAMLAFLAVRFCWR